MKLRLFALFLIVLSISTFSLTSCTKTTVQKITNYDTTTIVTHDTLVTRDTIVVLNAKNPIVGLWIGSQVAGDGSSIYPLYYSFDIRSDNTILTQGQGGDGNTFYSNGTWSLTGTAFTATITVSNFSQIGVKQNITAVYDSVAGKLTNGTVQTIGYPYSSTFTMSRIN